MRSVVLTPRDTTASEAVARWRDEPAPLLPILHDLQARDGYLREDALLVVAHELGIEPGDLYGVVTFYHYFRLERPAPEHEVCEGPACWLARGGEDPNGHAKIPCPGRCDRPGAVRRRDDFLEGVVALADAGCAPSPAVSGPAILKHAGLPDQTTLAGARERGAWKTFAALAEPQAVFSELRAAGLGGRGGAGFPAAAKWEAVRNASGSPKYVVVNADEGEPGTFKDRVLLEHDPHLVLEGAAIGARTVGARDVVVYLRYEYPVAFAALTRAIDEVARAGLAGDVRFHLRRGAGAYICGEETSLLNSLEGKKPFPRDKPPYPVTHGLDQKPTLLTNVETLAAAVRILEMGADGWRALGANGQPGTKLYSVSGDVARPGNFEAPFGITARELLLDMAGGPRPGRRVAAFTMGGLAGGLLPESALDMRLDLDGPKARGAMLGSGGIVVVDDSRCVAGFVKKTMDFFRDESCGKCFPCRIGTQRVSERLESLMDGRAGDRDFVELRDLSRLMSKLSACGLGLAAPAPLLGLLDHFPDEVAAHREGRCARAT